MLEAIWIFIIMKLVYMHSILFVCSLSTAGYSGNFLYKKIMQKVHDKEVLQNKVAQLYEVAGNYQKEQAIIKDINNTVPDFKGMLQY